MRISPDSCDGSRAHPRAAVSLTPLLRAILLALMVAGLGLLPSSAGAAVALRNKTCTTKVNSFGIPPYTITINKPAGTVAGDLMIATVTDTFTDPGAPSGWTLLFNSGNSDTWYKLAGGAEPASYDFSMFTSPDTAVGGIVSFSGVDPANPLATAGVQTTTGTAALISLPNTTATRAGSMRFSSVTSGAAVTSTYSAGMTESCDVNAGSLAYSSAYEAMGAGTTATRTNTRSGTGSHVSQTFVINPPSLCNGGGLTLTPPSTIAFPSATLNGLDQTLTTSMPLTVDDYVGTAAGWNLSATSTTFTSGAFTLPTTATSITSAADSDGGGQCTAPTNVITYPITLPAATVAPVASKIFNAASATGDGTTDITFGMNLAVPARAHVGTYSSTWTLTLSSGP